MKVKWGWCNDEYEQLAGGRRQRRKLKEENYVKPDVWNKKLKKNIYIITHIIAVHEKLYLGKGLEITE